MKTEEISTPTTEVWSTQTYEMFALVSSNREINPSHVDKLAHAIKQNNLLHLNPIIVNSRYEVMDGQHRLAAAKKLGVTIYYMIDDKVNKSQIAGLNSNKKNWQPIDYINFYYKEGVKEYAVFKKFLDQYPQFSFSIAFLLLKLDAFDRGAGDYKSGHIDVSNYHKACQIAEIICNYRNYCEFAFERNFCLAIRKIIETGVYNHEIMKTRLEYQRTKLVKCVTTNDYVKLLEEIYNYRSSTNRVRFFSMKTNDTVRITSGKFKDYFGLYVNECSEESLQGYHYVKVWVATREMLSGKTIKQAFKMKELQLVKES